MGLLRGMGIALAESHYGRLTTLLVTFIPRYALNSPRQEIEDILKE
jgi:hypothetical protein